MGFFPGGIGVAMRAAVTGINMLNPNPISFVARAGMLLLAGFLLLPPAEAKLLNPGATVTLWSANEPKGGHVVAVTNFNFSSTSFSGKLQSKVWADDESNPFGGLTFSYRLVNTGECDDSLGWFSLSGFASLLVDVNYSSGGVAPLTATRSTAAGDTISFGFFNREGEEAFEPGASSAWLVVQTSAQNWCVNQLVGVDTELVTAATFTPVAVPEPAALTLFVLAGAAFWMRRG